MVLTERPFYIIVSQTWGGGLTQTSNIHLNHWSWRCYTQFTPLSCSNVVPVFLKNAKKSQKIPVCTFLKICFCGFCFDLWDVEHGSVPSCQVTVNLLLLCHIIVKHFLLERVCRAWSVCSLKFCCREWDGGVMLISPLCLLLSTLTAC